MVLFRNLLCFLIAEVFALHRMVFVAIMCLLVTSVDLGCQDFHTMLNFAQQASCL